MSNFTRCLIFVIFSFGILIHQLVEGRTISTADAAIIKTIKTDNGEVFDCYDIDRQPVLKNPLFRDHVIQKKPSSDPFGKGQGNLKQNWNNTVSCPDGTVPIPRSSGRSGKKYHHPSKPTLSSKLLQPQSSDDVTSTHEYVAITPEGDNFQGAHAAINIWKPLVQPQEISTSQIWISAGDGEEVIEAGWIVNKNLYGDDEPRFFLYWTADGFNSTGCYNALCPGFVQTTSNLSLGSRIGNISIFNGQQQDATFSIFKEQSTGYWWVEVRGILVGYWPSFLFKELSEKATQVQFGGQIVKTNGRHTNTQMGSGHLPAEGGFGISSYFRDVKVLDRNYEVKVVDTVSKTTTNANCYDLKLDGSFFYYGGPGVSGICQ